MEIDLAAAARFLAALSPDNTHTFQTFDDAKLGRPGMTRILHGTFAKNADRLAAVNLKGAGIFVMVNRGDGYGRKAINVTACRALFLDLDGSPVEPVLAAPIPPRIVVESSPGKWHAYWPIVDLPPDRFTGAQKALAALYSGDGKVHDKPRVMRLPGFLHRKGEPFQTRLVSCDGGPVTWQEMAAAFDLSAQLSLPAVVPEGERNSTLFKLARSAASKGVPQSAQLEKALQVNAKRFHPPLSEAEVTATVASAYKGKDSGTVAIPLALLESPAFKDLDDSARLLLVLAYRRADGFNGGCVTLPWKELTAWFPRKNTFQDVRKRVVRSGLLPIAKSAIKSMPRMGRGPKSGFYQLAIGPFSAPYSNSQIGPFSAPPEALQAGAPKAPDLAQGVNGPNGGRK